MQFVEMLAAGGLQVVERGDLEQWLLVACVVRAWLGETHGGYL